MNFATALDRGDDIANRDRAWGELFLKAVDVSARAEEPVCAGDDDRFDLVVRVRGTNLIEQFRTICERKRVDRRIIERDYAYDGDTPTGIFRSRSNCVSLSRITSAEPSTISCLNQAACEST